MWNWKIEEVEQEVQDKFYWKCTLGNFIIIASPFGPMLVVRTGDHFLRAIGIGTHGW